MDIQHDEHAAWAQEVFGEADFGDVRRTRRLVAMAASAAHHPSGTIPAVFSSSAEREGAYRLLENPSVEVDALGQAMFLATARQCVGQPYVLVPMDGSSLTLTDRAKRRDLGRVGRHCSQARGLHVMSSLAVDPHGAIIGLLDQRMWAREQPPAPKKKVKSIYRVHYRHKETRHWVDSLFAVRTRMADTAPEVKPWFQLDRAGDCWAVLQTAVDNHLLLTTRATHNRRLVSDSGPRRYLLDELKRQPILGQYEVFVPEQPQHPSRFAHVTVRALTVTLDLQVSRKRHADVTLQGVFVEELDEGGTDRLQWTLLTTHPVTSFADAHAVVEAYTQRWRIEEFHRAWKAGGCNVEDTQLQRRQALVKWAMLLAAVAARAVRLAYLARTTPDVPASDEFTPDEIDAAFVLTKRKRDPKKRVDLREIIAMIADLGGFMHKYSGRHPGPTVLGRGLLRVEILAEGLKNMREM
jgi:hypothetical protein